MSDNRPFGMFHAHTPAHIQEVILSSLQKADGVVCVEFATVALGMGVNVVGLNNIIHYGAPRSIEDYVQESGRASRSGEQVTSVIFWGPSDAPLKTGLSIPTNGEIAAVRKYLEHTICCKYLLLQHFDISLAQSLTEQRNHLICCHVCAKTASISSVVD